MSKKIAVTGGIGSGKSSVVKILREKGYPVFSCDEIYADLINSTEYMQKLTAVFPQAVVDGRLDKKQLSAIVFNDSKQREVLNNLAHPIIMQRLFALMNEREELFVFAEVPLLFENGFERDFDGVIVVLRDTNERINAVRQRDGLTECEIKQRIRAQFNYDDTNNRKYLQTLNSRLIQNDGTKEDLIKRVEETLKNI